MDNMAKIKDAFLGCVVGCAVGDALGAPLEGRQAEPEGITSHSLFEDYVPIFGLPKGVWTDDTQLTLMLAESIVACGEISGQDFAQRLTNAFTRGETLGWGISTTRAASNKALRGANWDEMGDDVGRAGNGCAMRAGPIGLWLYDNMGSIAEKAREVSIVSHKDPRAIAGAGAVATAVAYCVGREDVAAKELIELLVQNTARFGEDFARELARLEERLEMDEARAVEEIVALGQFGPYKGSWGGRITPYVLPTVLICLYWFLRFPRDFTSAVGNTILTGGDVDTTGAICGAISGALNGVEAIPSHLVDNLYRGEEVKRVAERLFDAKHRGGQCTNRRIR